MSRIKLVITITSICLLLFGPIQGAQAEVQTIPLYEGWNLISFQVNPTNSAVTHLPSCLRHPATGENDPNALISIWGYDSQTDSWCTYQKDDSLLNDMNDLSLEQIESKKGYWIKVARDANLTIEGEIADGTVSFEPGWNLVGFVGFYFGTGETLSIQKVLGSHIVSVSQVWMFDAQNTQAYKGYTPQSNPPLHDFDSLKEGLGYWVYVTEAFILPPLVRECCISQYTFNGVDKGIQEGTCGENTITLTTNLGATLAGVCVSGNMTLSVGILMY